MKRRVVEIGPLEGTLVRLDPLDARHIDDFVEAAQEARETYALTDVPPDRDGMVRYIQRAVNERELGAMVPFAVVDLRTQAMVGSTRFCNFEYWRWQASHRRRPAGQPDAAEIGYTWLSSNAQRTGINRESKLLMLGVAFESWSISRVSFRIDARNARSRAAIEGIGARLDGVLRSAQAEYDGAIRDTAVYSILNSEWPTVRESLRSSLLRFSG